jgi:neurotransmitter:Na+ symporter, NSS family
MSRDGGSNTERWNSGWGAILAVAGSAVGLGNLVRFPGQVMANGGGAFMIPYFCAFVLLGIPIAWVEWTLARYGGHHGRHSGVGVLGLVAGRRVGRYFGALAVLIPLVIYMYYVVIEAWCLRYAWAYLSGSVDLGRPVAGSLPESEAFFSRVSGSEANGSLITSEPVGLVFWLLVISTNFLLVRRGLNRGIEAFCRWAMPLMALCALVVLARVLTLGTPDPSRPELNVSNALGYLWNPDLSRLGDAEVWLAAAGQIFFSLSVGFGIIINYASYLRRKDDVVLSALSAGAINEVFEVSFGGLITVTAAFLFLGASGTLGGTFGLGFTSLPVVFTHLGAWERPIGAAWFLMLFLAAITSSLSMLQPGKAFFEEALGCSPRRAVSLIGALSALGSLWVLYFSHGLAALDTMDFWIGTVAIFVLAGVEVVCFGWLFGVDRGLSEAHRGAQLRIPRAYRFIIKYVSPLYLGVVFLGFCQQSLPGYARALMADPIPSATLGLVALVFLLLLAAAWRAEQRSASQAAASPGPPSSESAR